MAAAISTANRVRLQVLTNSSISCFRRCPREYFFAYVLRRRPRRAADALRFGTFFHIGLNRWWNSQREGLSGEARLLEALSAMRRRAEEKPEETDEWDLVKAECLMVGYHVRWIGEPYETIGVEVAFEVPLVDPTTGKPSDVYRIGGKRDLVVRDMKRGVLLQGEHKTTSSDIGVGADYWRRVSAMDPQIGIYTLAGKAEGHDYEHTLYDVIRKVDLRPHKATPEESRKYTKPTKADPVPRLYKNQRETDESVDEYRERVGAHIAENPERYFSRAPVVRLERDDHEHAVDTWQTALAIHEAETHGRFPRNPGSCARFGRLCSFFDVCSGCASIDDETLFRTASEAHEELADTKEI